jgi:hypothetical protein
MPGTFLERGPLMRALIAPCGINCGVCAAYLRVKNRCAGCRATLAWRKCRIRDCDERRPGEKFCFKCPKFPCAWVRHLDKRYRTKYGASMIENQRAIAAGGINRFVAAEKRKWACRGCGKTLCMHRPSCVFCGAARAAPG